MTLISVQDYVDLPAVAADATYAYGDDPNQVVDLYLPQGAGLHPVIVLVHGGCWGEKYSAKPLGGIARDLTEAGFAVWNIEYRRNGNGGGYPQTLLDVGQAADLLRTVVAEHSLDLSRVVTMGHSAGGQLALWLAARSRLPATSPLYNPNPLAVRGVVCLAGVIDLVDAAAKGHCGDGLTSFMGGTPEQVPDHYQSASPKELVPLGVRQIHIIGELDELLSNVRSYIEAAQTAGDDAQLMIIPQADHFELVVATTAAWTTVREAAITLAGPQ
ncbi:MAG: alpha/beta hydrolase [Anaerolineae bacterium]|nr:alpha/beta hydrolase [Anaerolineae bacterium]